VCKKDLDAMGRACVRAAEWADLIELRLDCLDPDSRNISELVQNISCPVILTFRPSEQGGHRHLSRDKRLSFWKSAPRSENVWWDVEGDLLEDLPTDSAAIIASHHDFSGVPSDLQRIYEQLASTRAAVIKIAVQAHDIVDCIPVFQLLERARREGREIIAIAMGNAGLATRVLGPSRGSFLTYGALDNDSATAPGQVNAHKLRSLYHLDKIDRDTMICGLIGHPVMHSLSPRIHNAGFMSEEINGVYLPLEVRDVHAFCKRMVQPRTREIDWNLRGLSVTAPHKQAVMEHLDWIDPTAKEIGAVNTVVIDGERLLGYNTDAAGLIAPLLTRFGSLKDRQVAIIGAGGAARAAIWALTKQEANVTLFARNPTKAQPLAQSFDIRCAQLSSAAFAGYDLVINATPLGSGDHIDQSPATPEQLNGAGCIYDLIYNPLETKLLRYARETGCDTLGGLAMLLAQAKIQFELWTGKRLRYELSAMNPDLWP
jgi:3-dehydroquinate dehydratase/shikimate dehydrogenase